MGRVRVAVLRVGLRASTLPFDEGRPGYRAKAARFFGDAQTRLRRTPPA